MKNAFASLGFFACLVFLNAALIASENILAQTKNEPAVQLIGNASSDALALALKIGGMNLPLPSDGFKNDATGARARLRSCLSRTPRRGAQ